MTFSIRESDQGLTASCNGKEYNNKQLMEKLSETTVPVSFIRNGRVLTFSECVELYLRVQKRIFTPTKTEENDIPTETE